MRLKDLRLRNFRCFTDPEMAPIDLDSPVILLYGKNGLGKSSFFDAIEFALTGSIQRLQPLQRPIGELLVSARSTSQSCEVRLATVGNDGLDTVYTTTANRNTRSGTPALRTAKDIAAFQNSAYLAQWNIQQLVTTTPETLGDIIWKLVADPTLDRLRNGIAEAKIDRRSRKYQQVLGELRQAEEDSARVDSELKLKRDQLSSLRSVNDNTQIWIERIKNICSSIGVAFTWRETLLDSAEAITRIVQDQYSDELQALERTRRSQNFLNRLSAEQEELAGLESDLTKVATEVQGRAARITELNTDLNSLGTKLDSLTSRSGSFAITVELLQQVLKLKTDDLCPVCDRPFDDLSAHVSAKIQRLVSQVSELDKEVLAAQDSRARVVKQLDTVTREREQSTLRQENITSRINSFQTRLLDALKEIPDSVPRSLSEGMKYLESMAGVHEKRSSELRDATAELEKTLSEITAATLTLRNLSADVSKLEKDAERRKRNLGEARNNRERLEQYINTVSSVRSTVEEKFERVLDEFVRGRAVQGFSELFRRMTRNPYFTAEFAEFVIKNHKPTLEWFAACDGVRYPGTGVLSYGDLNACALSLFLSFALAQPAPLGFLAFDDPIQNMDDVHVEEFAEILKSIRNEAGLQLLLGIHDESVYEYLKRQLYPAKEGQRLIAYQLERTERGTALLMDVSAQYSEADFVTAGSTAA